MKAYHVAWSWLGIGPALPGVKPIVTNTVDDMSNDVDVVLNDAWGALTYVLFSNTVITDHLDSLMKDNQT